MVAGKEKTVGIIGGMGPEATVDLMQRIIKLTPAWDDIDHIRCIVDNNPKIPSRIKAIIDGDGEDPTPFLADMARKLEAYGADVLAIACNTAHFYFDAIQAAVKIPVIHMIDAVVDTLRERRLSNRKIGLLASPAVNITGIYEKKLAPANFEAIFPDGPYQQRLFDVIRAVKAGTPAEQLYLAYTDIGSHLKQKGADLAVVACTELSALDCTSGIDTLDAAQVLAQHIVNLVKQIR